MNKKFAYASGLAIFLATFSLINHNNVFAADGDTSAPTTGLVSTLGSKISFTDTASGALFEFQPSPQVNMTGDSNDQGFVVSGVHNSALNKTNGFMYAMSSETSGLYSASAAAATAALPSWTLPTDLTTMEAELKTAGFELEEKAAASN